MRRSDTTGFWSLNLVALALLTTVLSPLSAAQDTDASGKVTDESGKPIAGVTVSGNNHNKVGGYREDRVVTDENGHYDLRLAGRVLFFKKDGYARLTKLRAPGETVVDASLSKDNPIWKVPRCTRDSTNGRGWQGMTLKFAIPRGTNVKESEPDTDNWTVFVLFPGNRKMQMAIWSGPLLGAGPNYNAPDSWYLDGSTVTERIDSATGAVDIRGAMPNGRHWRSVSWITDIASYHDVSNDAATFFDQILESGCLLTP